MATTSLEFLALPSEQVSWLAELLDSRDVWCVRRWMPPNRKIERIQGSDSIHIHSFSTKDDTGGFELYFGNKEFADSPIWQTGGHGSIDIDFVRSQAIQYCPSMLVQDSVLLAGQMAIMRRSYYAEAGIDPKPLYNWFIEVVRSFRLLAAKSELFLCDPRTGALAECPGLVATAGAMDFLRTGHSLKQYLRGAYEFCTVAVS